MNSREEAIAYCMKLGDVYEDYPFGDSNWTVMRCRANQKTFAYIYEREGNIWVNLKVAPEWIHFWREVYEAVIPAFHMNKKHWNTVILDGTVPETEIQRMMGDSYDLVKPRKKRNDRVESKGKE